MSTIAIETTITKIDAYPKIVPPIVNGKTSIDTISFPIKLILYFVSSVFQSSI